MDPEKDEKLKQSAEALAYHVFGVFSSISALKNTVAGFDAGLRSIEQTFGPLPVALPQMPAPPSTDKKQKPSRRVRPALRPSGGSGVGALVSAAANAAGGGEGGGAAGTGSPNTMLALLDGLEKELHGAEQPNHQTLGAASQPLTTPNMAADGACVVGRLSDAHDLATASPSPLEVGDGAGPVAPSHGSTEALPAADDGSENENGASNEAGVVNTGDGPPSSAGGSGGGVGSGEQGDMPPPLPQTHQEVSAPVSNKEPEFTFDPLSTAPKTQPARSGGTKALAANSKRGQAEQTKDGSPSLGVSAKRTRKNVSSEGC